jgi:hypothetical protein
MSDTIILDKNLKEQDPVEKIELLFIGFINQHPMNIVVANGLRNARD